MKTHTSSFFLPGLVALTLTACSTQGFQPKPGQAEADFQQDHQHCQRLSLEKWENNNRVKPEAGTTQKSVPPSYERCMKTLGY
jgi:outer membrane biogenesis lipoprotein LolB